MRLLSYIVIYRRLLLIVSTLLLFLPLPLVLRTKEAECAYVLFVVGIFWLTEALPLSVTALLPGLMFALFGIMPSKTVASAYFKDFHLLLIGVICLATSIEKWNLHKRIALKMVLMVGVNPAWLTLGFMSSTAFLSMWLSNTSTAAMVMPIVEAVAQQIISAQAQVKATQMTYCNGSINPGLEMEEEGVNGHETNENNEKTNPVSGHSDDAEKISNKVKLRKLYVPLGTQDEAEHLKKITTLLLINQIYGNSFHATEYLEVSFSTVLYQKKRTNFWHIMGIRYALPRA